MTDTILADRAFSVRVSHPPRPVAPHGERGLKGVKTNNPPHPYNQSKVEIVTTPGNKIRYRAIVPGAPLRKSGYSAECDAKKVTT